MTDIVTKLQHITSNSRLAKEKEIQEVLKEIEWDSIRDDSVESAENSAKQGKSSVEITITPTQRIGSCCEERYGSEWTPAKAYRRAFDEHTKSLFSKLGFAISTRIQPDWHSGTFLYCYTLSWDDSVPEDAGDMAVSLNPLEDEEDEDRNSDGDGDMEDWFDDEN